MGEIKLVDKEIYNKRINICKECPALYAIWIGGESRFTEKNVCGVCHCNMDVKAEWESFSCPASKW